MEQENNEAQNKDEKNKKKVRKTRKTAQPLPDPRLNVDKQIKIIKAICAASDKGSKYVSSQEIAPLASVHDTEASGVCGFFFKIGMLDRDNYKYKPKEALVTFCNDLEWAPDSASVALKDEFLKTWFGKSTVDYFKVNKEASKDSLIKNLGRVAQADSYHKRSLSTLVDFLNYAGIINFDESSKKYVVVNEVSFQEPRSPELKKNKLEQKEAQKHPQTSVSDTVSKNRDQLSSVGTIINVNLDVKFSDDTDPETLAAKIKKFKELIK